jgi:hypothetical protein
MTKGIRQDLFPGKKPGWVLELFYHSRNLISSFFLSDGQTIWNAGMMEAVNFLSRRGL